MRNKVALKILISSHAFLPSLGGLENVSVMLADGFIGAGHEVRLVTETVGAEEPWLPYPVMRRSTPRALLSLVRWCDVYFHNGLSLRSAWPLLFVRRPWVVAHQTWIPWSGSGGWTGRLKHYALTRSTNIAISTAIAADLRVPSIVIGNPYDNLIFRELVNVQRDRDLVFCGRLVADKGTDILLKALGILTDKGLYPNLSIIGTGPEEPKLRLMARALALESQVTFEGKKSGSELAQRLNAHRIMVVPSRWREPFGIVALEGTASGCVVVGSEGGGLKEAIGPCGVTFPSGDAGALAGRLEELLRSPQLLAGYRANVAAHLSAYTRPAVAEEYLRIFAAATQRYPRRRVSAEGASEAEVVYGFKD
jgi:glycogen(starch) synthase